MDKLNAGFVICSRLASSRVPKKCLVKLNGVPLIEHLIKRCEKSGYPVFLAVPGKDYEEYRYLLDIFPALKIHIGQAEDPLSRTANVAAKYELDAVIRVCHDKIFIEPELVQGAIEIYNQSKVDYVFSSTAPAGSSFEIISTKALNIAAQKFQNVEHISYSIRAVTDKIADMNLTPIIQTDHRFLVDYPEDVRVLDLVLQSLGNDCSLFDAARFLDQHAWISRINQTPKITVYTCAYNAEKWINKAMGSVSKQNGFAQMEYLLIDDHSSDSTSVLMSKFCSIYKNAKWIKNEKNLGLASSSNIALSRARGRYIVRLDADDFFVSDRAIEKLVSTIEQEKADIVYPANYYGSFKMVQAPTECHHVGGAIFSTRAANHVKFTEGLRGYEGLDFFTRARSQLKIAYLNSPIFFYRQHDASLSKNNLEERAKILENINSLGAW